MNEWMNKNNDNDNDNDDDNDNSENCMFLDISAWMYKGESWCGSDSKDYTVRNSINVPTGSRVLRL